MAVLLRAKESIFFELLEAKADVSKTFLVRNDFIKVTGQTIVTVPS